MLNICICDDNALELRYIHSLVLDWSKKSGEDLSVSQFQSADALLFSYEDILPDILLLDIEMPGMNGITLAKSLRSRHESAQIVFITGYPDFISEGYEVEALHYLIKPVEPEKLFGVLNRAAGKILRVERKILLPLNGGAFAVPMREIRYIEAQRQYSVIYTLSGQYRIKTPISEILTRLDEYFLRVQRSFIVNLREVLRITRTAVILKSGDEVPISRGMAEKIGKKIIELF